MVFGNSFLFKKVCDYWCGFDRRLHWAKRLKSISWQNRFMVFLVGKRH